MDIFQRVNRQKQVKAEASEGKLLQYRTEFEDTRLSLRIGVGYAILEQQIDGVREGVESRATRNYDDLTWLSRS